MGQRWSGNTSSLRLAVSDGVRLMPIPEYQGGTSPHSGDSFEATPLSDSGLTVDTIETLTEWRVWMSASLAPKSVNYYWTVAFRYLSDVPKPLPEHTEMDVATWLERWPHRSAARRSYYNGLLNLFGWAARNGYVAENICREIQVKAPPEKVARALTDEQLQAVIAAAFKRHPVRGYALELLYYSGARINEVLNLRWDDATDEGLVLRITKGSNRERLVPWSDGLRHAWMGLRSHFGEQPYVVPRSAQTVWLWCRQAGVEAGVPDVHPHLFRATTATRAMQRGARAHAVRELLGHSKLTTTQRYMAPERGDVQEAVNLL